MRRTRTLHLPDSVYERLGRLLLASGIAPSPQPLPARLGLRVVRSGRCFHERTEANTYVRKLDGKLCCRACNAAASRKFRAKVKARWKEILE